MDPFCFDKTIQNNTIQNAFVLQKTKDKRQLQKANTLAKDKRHIYKHAFNSIHLILNE